MPISKKFSCLSFEVSTKHQEEKSMYFLVNFLTLSTFSPGPTKMMTTVSAKSRLFVGKEGIFGKIWGKQQDFSQGDFEAQIFFLRAILPCRKFRMLGFSHKRDFVSALLDRILWENHPQWWRFPTKKFKNFTKFFVSAKIRQDFYQKLAVSAFNVRTLFNFQSRHHFCGLPRKWVKIGKNRGPPCLICGAKKNFLKVFTPLCHFLGEIHENIEFAGQRIQ